MTRIDYLAPELLGSDDDDMPKQPSPHEDHPPSRTGYAFWEVLILSFILYFIGLMLFAQTPTPVPDSLEKINQRWRADGFEPAPIHGPLAPGEVAPYPGYWHMATAGALHYAPCYPLPYTQFTDPSTGNVGYFRYDFGPYQYTGHSACGLVPAPCIDGQGGPNHTRQGYGFPLNYLVPLEPDPDVNNYYPVPEADTGMGAIWAQFNTPPPAFPGTDYSYRMKSNPIWVTAYNYKKPVMDADPGCHATGPTPTRTKTPVPVTPTRTPTPAPNIYAAYITWAANNGITSGCGGGNFCPDNPVTRAQMTTFLWNLYHMEHPGSVLPPCQQQFNDVLCKP